MNSQPHSNTDLIKQNRASTKSIRPLTEEEVARFNEEGYIIIRNMFTEDEIKPLQEAYDKDPNFGGAAFDVQDKEGKDYRVSVWSHFDETYIGLLPRTARIIDAIEALLEEECYHWHSKIVVKNPGDGKVEWHSGFAAWYRDGCLYPRTITCSVAINKNTIENGCLQVLKGSHETGRIHNVPIGSSTGAELVRLGVLFERYETVYCEMEPGDVLFFHANTLHGSDGNNSNGPRLLSHSAFNARSNEPIFRERQKHHLYAPIMKLPDSVLRDRKVEAYDKNTFHTVESDDTPGAGIFIRDYGAEDNG